MMSTLSTLRSDGPHQLECYEEMGCCCCETHNAHALRTPKHGGRNRNGRRRGRNGRRGAYDKQASKQASKLVCLLACLRRRDGPHSISRVLPPASPPRKGRFEDTYLRVGMVIFVFDRRHLIACGKKQQQSPGSSTYCRMHCIVRGIGREPHIGQQLYP